MHCNVLAANNVTQQQTGPFRYCQGVMGMHSTGDAFAASNVRQRGRSVINIAACVQFMFGKTSLALVFMLLSLFPNLILGSFLSDQNRCSTDITMLEEYRRNSTMLEENLGSSCASRM